MRKESQDEGVKEIIHSVFYVGAESRNACSEKKLEIVLAKGIGWREKINSCGSSLMYVANNLAAIIYDTTPVVVCSVVQGELFHVFLCLF